MANISFVKKPMPEGFEARFGLVEFFERLRGLPYLFWTGGPDDEMPSQDKLDGEQEAARRNAAMHMSRYLRVERVINEDEGVNLNPRSLGEALALELEREYELTIKWTRRVFFLTHMSLIEFEEEK